MHIIMEKYFLVFLVFLAVSCKNDVNLSLDEQNISESEHLVAATNWYQKSAEMRACYFQAFNLAKLQLKLNKTDYKGEKPAAVILDIDETVLDNSPFQAHLINTGQLYNSKLWKEWTDQKTAKSLPGAVEFTKFAKDLGVEVIYISNRKVDALAETIENMKTYNFPNADSSFVFLKKETSDKTARRKKVFEKYEVLLFVGDNLTDFDEAFAERDSDLGFALVDAEKDLFGSKYIVLPNPMYGNWEGAIYGGDYSLSVPEKRKMRQDILEGY